MLQEYTHCMDQNSVNNINVGQTTKNLELLKVWDLGLKLFQKLPKTPTSNLTHSLLGVTATVMPHMKEICDCPDFFSP